MALDIVDWSCTTSYPSLSFLSWTASKSNICSPQTSPVIPRSIYPDAQNELKIWISCVFVQELGELILRIILVASTNSKIVYFLFTLTCNETYLFSPKYEKKITEHEERKSLSLPLNGSEEIQESNSKNFLWMKREKRETKKKTKEKKKMLSNGIFHVCLLRLSALRMEETQRRCTCTRLWMILWIWCSVVWSRHCRSLNYVKKKRANGWWRRIREKVQFRFRDWSAADKRSSNTFDFELMDVCQWSVRNIDYKNVNEPQNRQHSRKFSSSSITVVLIKS